VLGSTNYKLISNEQEVHPSLTGYQQKFRSKVSLDETFQVPTLKLYFDDTYKKVKLILDFSQKLSKHIKRACTPFHRGYNKSAAGYFSKFL